MLTPRKTATNADHDACPDGNDLRVSNSSLKLASLVQVYSSMYLGKSKVQNVV